MSSICSLNFANYYRYQQWLLLDKSRPSARDQDGKKIDCLDAIYCLDAICYVELGALFSATFLGSHSCSMISDSHPCHYSDCY